MEFSADTHWVQSFPSRWWRARAKEALFSILAIAGAAYWGGWVLYSMFALIVGYWGITLLLYVPASIMRSAASSKIEISEIGMRQSSLRIKDLMPIEVFTPWNNIEQIVAKRKNGEVQQISVIDSSLPKGVRKIQLEGYENMETLLQEIESRSGSKTNA